MHGYRLSQAALAEQIARLRVGTQAARERIIGLDPRRADVILAGALILQRIAVAAPARRNPGQRPRNPLGPHARAGPEICRPGPRLIRPGSDGIFLGMRRAWLPWIAGLACMTADRRATGRPPIRRRSPTTSNARSSAQTGTPPRPPTASKAGSSRSPNAYNHPAWLRRRLPPTPSIDFDVVSRSPAGDIKVEMYGDGESFDPDKGSYDSTGYVLIFGGWHNTLSVICRMKNTERGAKRNETTSR